MAHKAKAQKSVKKTQKMNGAIVKNKKSAKKVVKAALKTTAKKLAKRGTAGAKPQKNLQLAAAAPSSAASKSMQVINEKVLDKVQMVESSGALQKGPEPKRMDVKRAKQALEGESVKGGKKVAKGRAKRLAVDAHKGESAAALALKWTTLFRRSQQIESKPYNMRMEYAEKTAIVHKVLGWGYILANRNDRLEVLFEQGIKVLISNYKSE